MRRSETVASVSVPLRDAEQRADQLFVAIVVALCLAPSLLHVVWGIDFGTHPAEPRLLGSFPETVSVDELHYLLRGNISHALLEWTGCCTAILTWMLTVAYYQVRRDIVTAVIGVSLFWAGCMDGFHTLAAVRLIDATTPIERLIPFTWSICRLFNALILLAGVSAVLFWHRKESHVGNVVFVTVISVAFGLAAFLIVVECATSEQLPETFRPDALITRPSAIAPLLLYSLAGFVFFPILHQRQRNFFSLALWVSAVPHVATELHMAFGSTQLFDHHFNVAHFTKVLAYLVPFFGLAVNYMRIHRSDIATQEQLRLSEERCERAVQGSADGLWDWDIETGDLWIARRCRELLGYAGDDIETVPDTLESLNSRLHPDDFDRTWEAIQRHLSDGTAYDVEYRLRTKSGVYRWFRARGAAVRDASGRATRMAGSIRDIDALKRATEARKQLNAELQRSNQELDRFAHVASHDLKSPLQALHSLCQWFQEDAGDELSEKSRTHLDKMQERIGRLEGLLDDLFQYARAGRARGKITTVDVGQLVRDAVEVVAPPSEFRITIAEDFPRLTTCKTPLSQVFRNLIGNAIKHHHGRAGCVDITWDDRGDFVEFCVADDGPGIPDEFHDRVFGMFQTLHPRDRTRGAGVGLAIVKKMVEHYNGRVTVESGNGNGACFRFTWPKTITVER